MSDPLNLNTTFDPWSTESMDNYLAEHGRQAAARGLIAARKHEENGADHNTVVSYLIGACNKVTGDERDHYRAALNNYLAKHGHLQGVYETDKGRLGYMKLRPAANGNRDRYFYHHPSPLAFPRTWAVVDRNTGTIALDNDERMIFDSREEADAWIATKET